MKKFMKRFLALALAVAVCITCYQPLVSKADNLSVSVKGGPWAVSEGVTAVVENGVLYFKGSGEIPDYQGSALYKRPWDGCIFEGVIVEPTITRIGSYALANYPRLKYITISSKTFIQDSTTFHGLNTDTHIRVTGTEETETKIGEIPYTSIMSIVRDAQDHPGYMYFIDYNYNWKMHLFKMTYPALTNIYYANNEDVLIQREAYRDPDWYDADTYTSPLKYAKGSSGPVGTSLRATRKIQGYYLYLHLSNFMTITNPGYSWGTVYSVDALDTKGNQVSQLKSPQTFVFDIPDDLRRAGRTFRVMVLMSNATGEVVTFEDLDMNANTITFTTDRIGVKYALIYQDTNVIPGLTIQ